MISRCFDIQVGKRYPLDRSQVNYGENEWI